MSVPFHKQTNASKLAGQIVYPLPESTYKQAGQIVNPIPEQFLHQSHKQETTLAQYIERKTDEPKKITFDEWWDRRFGLPFEECDFNLNQDDLRSCWNAAIKHGKIS